MGEYSPLDELNHLKEFQDHMGFGDYAQGFGLIGFSDLTILETEWSNQPLFLDRLLPFAQADSTGSFYALWRVDDSLLLSSSPVTVFGPGGATHVVAGDVLSLFRLLALDIEPTITPDQVTFVDRHAADGDGDGRGTIHHDDYLEWLQELFGLAPAKDGTALVTEAQEVYADPFRRWIAPFLA